MFYLTTRNTFYLVIWHEENVLFNNTQHILFTVIWHEENVLFNKTVNTFYLQLYGTKIFFI